MYCPIGFAVAYAEYLIGITCRVRDGYLESTLYDVMVEIRNDLMRDPSISWYQPLIRSGCWVDVTSNKEKTLKIVTINLKTTKFKAHKV